MKIVLAQREAELMQVLWEHGPSTVAEVQGHLKDELAYTTLLTVHRSPVVDRIARLACKHYSTAGACSQLISHGMPN